jgi:hypothetical protein
MNVTRLACSNPLSLCGGLTLMEVVFSLAIVALTIGSVVTGYVFAAQEMEGAACSAAAEFMAQRRVEQARAAKWDALADPPVDELVGSNFPVVMAALDIPVAGNNPRYATSTTSIAVISNDPPLKLIRVDCVWSLSSRGPFTNTVATWRAPDQ